MIVWRCAQQNALQRRLLLMIMRRAMCIIPSCGYLQAQEIAQFSRCFHTTKSWLEFQIFFCVFHLFFFLLLAFALAVVSGRRTHGWVGRVFIAGIRTFKVMSLGHFVAQWKLIFILIDFRLRGIWELRVSPTIAPGELPAHVNIYMLHIKHTHCTQIFKQKH